mmetsp:Transcript_22502/g.56442  ORF Transcript_22502/g.56442 Transcript_22502/m.56442 type:complete len:208 (-) Transcript_22502:1245-1868(-)
MMCLPRADATQLTVQEEDIALRTQHQVVLTAAHTGDASREVHTGECLSFGRPRTHLASGRRRKHRGALPAERTAAHGHHRCGVGTQLLDQIATLSREHLHRVIVRAGPHALAHLQQGVDALTRREGGHARDNLTRARLIDQHRAVACGHPDGGLALCASHQGEDLGRLGQRREHLAETPAALRSATSGGGTWSCTCHGTLWVRRGGG